MLPDPLLLLTAILLDVAIGDPIYRWHPVRWIGAISLASEQFCFARGWTGRGGGLLHWWNVVTAALGLWWLIHTGLTHLHPALAWCWDCYLATSLLCVRGLIEQGERVRRDLTDLPAARQHLHWLVGRDTAPLDRAGIVRATIESLAENLTDAVLTPLWAFCLFGLPGLIAVKAVSTLDSLVGYKNARYAQFGWAAARSDDCIHWLPARLSVVFIATAAAVLRCHAASAIRTAWRYHRMLPSPNSGWSEAACAGALQVRLLGPIWRKGQLINTAFMGEPQWPTDLNDTHLQRALQLMTLCTLFAVLIGMAVACWLGIGH